VPLAISRPDRRWTLIEPRQRRAAFLEEVVRTLDLNAQVAAKTAELCAADDELRESHVLATGRAVHEPVHLGPLADPLLLPGGVTLVFKGEEDLERLPPHAEEWAPGLIIMRKPFEVC
jgi:16S rRNA (guanine527-N7)-methyltransferase